MTEATPNHKRRRNRKKRNQDEGWTTVTHTKPRKVYEMRIVEVPHDIQETLSPLESAVYNLLLNNSKKALTSEEIAQQCRERCARSDIGNLIYDGRLNEYIEAESYKEKPRRWRLKQKKVEIN